MESTNGVNSWSAWRTNGFSELLMRIMVCQWWSVTKPRPTGHRIVLHFHHVLNDTIPTHAKFPLQGYLWYNENTIHMYRDTKYIMHLNIRTKLKNVYTPVHPPCFQGAFSTRCQLASCTLPFYLCGSSIGCTLCLETEMTRATKGVQQEEMERNGQRNSSTQQKMDKDPNQVQQASTNCLFSTQDLCQAHVQVEKGEMFCVLCQLSRCFHVSLLSVPTARALASSREVPSIHTLLWHVASKESWTQKDTKMLKSKSLKCLSLLNCFSIWKIVNRISWCPRDRLWCPAAGPTKCDQLREGRQRHIKIEEKSIRSLNYCVWKFESLKVVQKLYHACSSCELCNR